MADEFCLKMPDFHVTFRDLLHVVKLRHGTNGFTSLPKEGVLRIFFTPKNPTASAGFEPANLGTKGQHATSRPPKPLSEGLNVPPIISAYWYIPNCFFFFLSFISPHLSLLSVSCWCTLPALGQQVADHTS